jgi:hypothetical protein
MRLLMIGETAVEDLSFVNPSSRRHNMEDMGQDSTKGREAGIDKNKVRDGDEKAEKTSLKARKRSFGISDININPES